VSQLTGAPHHVCVANVMTTKPYESYKRSYRIHHIEDAVICCEYPVSVLFVNHENMNGVSTPQLAAGYSDESSASSTFDCRQTAKELRADVSGRCWPSRLRLWPTHGLRQLLHPTRHVLIRQHTHAIRPLLQGS